MVLSITSDASSVDYVTDASSVGHMADAASIGTCRSSAFLKEYLRNSHDHETIAPVFEYYLWNSLYHKHATSQSSS